MEFKSHHLSSVRLSDQVKDLITRAIFGGELHPGDKLPSEDRIAHDLGVSKVTVREALREMETHGLVVKRRGIYGGSFVAEPDSGKFSNLVMNYYRLGTITPEELAEFRQILEPSLIALATERRTEEDLKAIRLKIEEFEKNLEEGHTDKKKGIEFHLLIAQACHNRLISTVMASLIDVFEDILSKVPISLKDGMTDLDYCKQFYRCLRERKKEEARRLMVAHFDTLIEIVHRQKEVSTPSVRRKNV